MRKLITIHMLGSAAALCLFHLLVTHQHSYFSYINLLFLVIGSTALFYSRGVLFVLTILSWLFFPLFLLVYRVGTLNAALPVFMLNGLFLGIATHHDIMARTKERWRKRMEKETEEKKILVDDFGKLVKSENDIRDRELKTVNLYEITREMSGSLKFDEIFHVMSDFMKDNFVFRKCELAILKRDAPEPQVERVYSVWRNKKLGDLDYKILYEKLVAMLADRSVAVHFKRWSDRNIFKEVGIEDDEVAEFIAIPLLNERRIVAVLCVDNLLSTDIEKFMILSTQFALEIRKVLLYETVEELAITDGLTGLFVRRYFLGRLNEELYRSQRYKFTFAFLMFDIDDFKKCNDTYGHLVGDVVLKDMARIMKEHVREIDLIARYGGEEFAVILPETNREGAKLVAERIRRKVEESLFKAYDEMLKLTVSIGVAVYPEDSNEAKGIMEKADAALYMAKRAGKNIVCEYKK